MKQFAASPTPIESRGNGVCPSIHVPHHLDPPTAEKNIPPISGIGYHWQFLKTPPFSGFLGKSTPPHYPLSRKKWESACGPLMHSSGVGKSSLWGGGGGHLLKNARRSTPSQFHRIPLQSICRANT